MGVKFRKQDPNVRVGGTSGGRGGIKNCIDGEEQRGGVRALGDAEEVGAALWG